MASHPEVDPRLAKLKAGEPLEFSTPPQDIAESDQEREARTISAEWLELLAARPTSVVSLPIRIRNAIIRGPLEFQYATFDSEVLIIDCEFLEQVNLAFATFKRSAIFRGSRFHKDAYFRAAHVESDLEIVKTCFFGGASFARLQIGGLLRGSGAQFHGWARFEETEINMAQSSTVTTKATR